MVVISFKKEYMAYIEKAFDKGKKIQFKIKDPTAKDSWSSVQYPAWNWDLFTYRIDGKIKKE